MSADFHLMRLKTFLKPPFARMMLAGMLIPQFCVIACVASESELSTQAISGQVTSVTLYRDQARVIREIQIPASDQLQQIRVAGLPLSLVEGSSFTESDEGTNVRNLQVILPDTMDEKSDGKFEAEMKKLRLEQKSNEHDLTVIEQDLLTLEKLVEFSADKVHQNLDRATLDVQSVTALADFTMERRRRLAQELYEKQTELETINEKIVKLEAQDASKETKPHHYEALMVVQSEKGGNVRLAYDVGAVGWNPRYKINGAIADQPEFTIQMEAVITQNSGESWKDVALTLATSTPQTQAAGPSLAPLRVNTAPIAPSGNRSATLNQFSSADVSQWLSDELAAQNLDLNTQAAKRQIDELTSTAEIQREIAADATTHASDEAYSIRDEVTLDSGPESQTVTVLRTTTSGKLHRVVTPLLSSFAFREAVLLNESGQTLIAGAADVYLDKTFVGRIDLPPTAAGQKMTIGFGRDRQVRTRRELLAREETIKGGNRRSELVYRLVISNFHEAPISIRLLDRVPITAKDDSINLTFSPEETQRLSTDGLYQRMLRPTGVLRWDIEVPGNRFGSEAFDHEYRYSIEYDREQTLASDDLVQRTRDDLQFKNSNMGGGMGGGMF